MNGKQILALLLCLLPTTLGEVVLDKKTMKLALTSGELSDMVYDNDPSSEGYDLLKVFTAG
jgi:hypothetical protein